MLLRKNNQDYKKKKKEFFKVRYIAFWFKLLLNIGNLNLPYKIQHFRWWQVNPWAHNNPVSLFRSWLEKKQLNSKGNSTQKTLQTWEGTALSLWTHWTVLTAESRATFVYAAPLTWSYQNTAGSQRNSALLCRPWSWSKQEKGPVRNAYLQMLGFQALEVSHFRHWNMLLREVKDLSLGTFKRHGCGT